MWRETPENARLGIAPRFLRGDARARCAEHVAVSSVDRVFCPHRARGGWLRKSPGNTSYVTTWQDEASREKDPTRIGKSISEEILPCVEIAFPGWITRPATRTAFALRVSRNNSAFARCPTESDLWLWRLWLAQRVWLVTVRASCILDTPTRAKPAVLLSQTCFQALLLASMCHI